MITIHYLKSVHIRSYSGPYFPAFTLNRGRCSVSLCIQCEWGKILTRITPNKDNFYAVIIITRNSFSSKMELCKTIIYCDKELHVRFWRRVLNTLLVTLFLIFVDQNNCRMTRNIEKPEQNPWKTDAAFFLKICRSSTSNFT